MNVDIGGPKRHPWRRAVLAVLPTYAVLLVVVLPRHSGNDANTAGKFLVPAVFASLVVGAIANEARRPLRWWSYLLTAAVAMGMVGALYEVVILKDYDSEPDIAADSPMADPETGAGVSSGIGSMLLAPDLAGEWAIVDSRAARVREHDMAHRVDSRFGDELFFVYGEYRRGIDTLAYIGLNSRPDTQIRLDLQTSPSASVQEYLAGSDVTSVRLVESGHDDVAMACGRSERPKLRRSVICAWADAAALGITNWTVPRLDIDGAAELTRRFRSHVSQPID